MGLEIDQGGYVLTDKQQKTNIPRIYAAGDNTGGFKQWIVASGEGAVAALSVYEDLQR